MKIRNIFGVLNTQVIRGMNFTSGQNHRNDTKCEYERDTIKCEIERDIECKVKEEK